jgi:VanZ family protein
MTHSSPRSQSWTQTQWIVTLVFYIAFLALVSFTAYMGALPPALEAIPFYDTIGHFFLIGFASFLTHRAFRRRTITLGTLTIPIGPLVIAVLTSTDEMLQGFSPVRTLSAVDLSADFLGILAFQSFDRWLVRRSHPSTRP